MTPMPDALHALLLSQVARYPKWKLKAIPHEASHHHLGYGDIHISLLALHRPKNILAIGSQYGFIPAILGLMAKSYGGQVDFVDANYDEKVVGIAAHGGVGYWTDKHQQEFIQFFDLQSTIQFYIETTQQFFAHNQRRYQYVYIDGDHSYEGVSDDFAQASRCCDPGSFILLHDAKVDDGWHGFRFGVKKLLSETTQPHIVIGNFPGLAIVQV